MLTDEQVRRWRDEAKNKWRVADGNLLIYKKADHQILQLAEELLRVREELASWELGLQTAEESIVALQLERVALRTAITAALRELGVPTISYPAPVANAVEILEAALEGEGNGE